MIRAWWRRWPWAGVAIATGVPSLLVVLDLDRGHRPGANGIETLRQRSLELPATIMATTRSGGVHAYFTRPGAAPGSVMNFAAPSYGGVPMDGVDGRGDGGYVVAPPTPGYAWAPGRSPDSVALSEAPYWLTRLFTRHVDVGIPVSPSVRAALPALMASPCRAGSRNNTLAQIAGHLARRGLAVGDAIDQALAWNVAMCTPPLERSEVIRTVRSIYRTDARRRTLARLADTGAPVVPAGEQEAVAAITRLPASVRALLASNDPKPRFAGMIKALTWGTAPRELLAILVGTGVPLAEARAQMAWALQRQQREPVRTGNA